MRGLLLVLLLTSASAAERLTLTGSSTVAPLMAEIARRYEMLHPEWRIDVQTGGSTRGITDARLGRADLGMASRALRSDEHDLIGHVIAYDGIAVIAHRTQRVRELSRQQVIDLFTGTATSWALVGGDEATPLIVSKAEGRSTLELFCAHFGLEPARIHARSVIGDNAQGIKTVAAHRDSLGYVSIGAAETAIADGVAIRLLALDGVVPSGASLRKGAWPLSRPLILITRDTPSPAVANLLAYAQSPAVDDLILELGFVPPPR